MIYKYPSNKGFQSASNETQRKLSMYRVIYSILTYKKYVDHIKCVTIKISSFVPTNRYVLVSMYNNEEERYLWSNESAYCDCDHFITEHCTICDHYEDLIERNYHCHGDNCNCDGFRPSSELKLVEKHTTI
jgi:hypothetical protein